MGNCMAGEAAAETVRIMTDVGGIMELEGPVQVKSILDDFPGYGVFRQGTTSTPLRKHEQLSSGQLYYLFLLPKENKEASGELDTKESEEEEGRAEATEESEGQMRTLSSGVPAGPEVEVLPSPGKGVWKVKMVIGRKQLAEILAEQANTEALIERMRMAASQGGSSPKPAGKGGWRHNLSSACKPGQEDCK